MTTILAGFRPRLLAILFLAAATTVGCSQGPSLGSPTAPSTTLGSTTFLSSDEGAPTVETYAKGGIPGGNGRGRGNNSDDSEDEDAGRGKGPGGVGNPGHGHQDKVVGFVRAKNGDTLTVNGITVAAGTDAIIRHGHLILTIGDIEVGDHVQARGEMEGTQLTATEIKVQDTGKDEDEEDEDNENE